MATIKDLRDRVFLLLCSKAAGKVKLTLDGVTFSGVSFVGLVAPALLRSADGDNRTSKVSLVRNKAGEATVKLVSGTKGIGIRLGHLPKDAAAAYHPVDNVYDFPDDTYGTTPFQRLGIIHESIHASFDVAKVTITALLSEAVAYVGGVLFHLHDTVPAGGTPPAAPVWASSRYAANAEAYRIASGLWSANSSVVSEADAKAMCAAITSVKLYAPLKANPKMPAVTDGVT
jgi:hypothetical protein